MNWREQWYADRGLPYEPAKLIHCPPFQCVGGVKVDVPKHEPKLRPPVRSFHEREPGEDSQADVYGDAA